jgi:hypothetical protein
MFALSLLEEHAVVLPPIVLQRTAVANKIKSNNHPVQPSRQRLATEVTNGYLTLTTAVCYCRIFFDSILELAPLPLHLVTSLEFRLIVVLARRKVQVNKFPIFRCRPLTFPMLNIMRAPQ